MSNMKYGNFCCLVPNQCSCLYIDLSISELLGGFLFCFVFVLLAWFICNTEYGLMVFLASLALQMVKNLSAMWETWVQSLGWKVPLENGNPFQYSHLENSMDVEAWQATVLGITNSQTSLSDYHFHFFLFFHQNII